MTLFNTIERSSMASVIEMNVEESKGVWEQNKKEGWSKTIIKNKQQIRNDKVGKHDNKKRKG